MKQLLTAPRADEGALADVMEALATRGDIFRLEHAGQAAALAATLLASACARRAAAGVAMLASLMSWFGGVMKATCEASPSAFDLSFEARRQRCAAARAALLSALPALPRLAAAPGEPGARARQLAAALQALAQPGPSEALPAG